MEVMITLWDKDKATGKEVWQKIKSTRKAALTTVLTVMDRLSRKGIISKSKEGGLLVYRPSITREAYTRQVAGKMLKDYMKLSGSSLIASFVDVLDELEEAELEKFSAIIDMKKNGRG